MDESESFRNMTSTVSKIIRSKNLNAIIPEITQQKTGKVEFHSSFDNSVTSTIKKVPLQADGQTRSSDTRGQCFYCSTELGDSDSEYCAQVRPTRKTHVSVVCSQTSMKQQPCGTDHVLHQS